MNMKSILQQQLERTGTNSVKWDGLERWFHLSEEVLPLWVADIDIRTAPSISEALANKAAQGEFGYTLFAPEAQEAVRSWYGRRHDLDVDPKHVLFSSGVVPALTHIVEALTEVGDGVVIQSPVYPPFHELVIGSKRQVFDAPLNENDGRYEMDFVALEEAMKQAKLFLLCSPHNPVGRVWTRAELEKVVELANQYDVIVVADEIHADLTFPSHKHTAIGSLDPRVITVSAPSKAFNIAGLFASYIICPVDEWRKQITKVQNKHHVLPTPFANTAIIAAYTDKRAEQWLDQLREELEQQMSEVIDSIETYLPMLRTARPEASYLLWIDFSELPMSAEERKSWLHQDVRIFLSPGTPFGPQGEAFERMNIGTRRELLDEAIQRLSAQMKRKAFV
jgi:cystathionine beta-lyase